MKRCLRSASAGLLGAMLLMASPFVLAADTSQAVQFQKGTSGAEIKGKITGSDVSDFTLVAKKGQRMQVYLKSKRLTTYYNVMGPNSSGEALFNGSMSEDNYDSILPESGKYTIRVYQMGGVKDDNKTTPFVLKVRIY
ncbi:DNA breaking-rejoining protein [Plesiomonas shigelloides]|uniref:DNA breaking-rejoining protein n=1 Tax=Plesiomonas shigelloides TaxID=703 RepID=A0A8I2B6E2_PLESH|nr:DNA breaking-rejoining protein [Plesiomonas shigelloides]MBO1109588.1 DNA breaking-rejoining protein [Plesiomonas shigelloides]